MDGNEKRIESCKKIGASKKKIGHVHEKLFTSQYNINDINNPIEYKATSDTQIDVSHPIYGTLKDKLKITGNNVSNKSGNTIQFTLGKIPEFEDITLTKLNNSDFIRKVFRKYLKKIESERPVDILVYKFNDKWVFFNIDDIIEFIVDECEWRILETGRVKGDFYDNSPKGKRQYLTYEYRPKHKSHFLGANGGKKGLQIIELLMDNISYVEDTI